MNEKVTQGLRRFGHFFKHLGICGASTACGVATVGAGAVTLVTATGTVALASTVIGIPLAMVTTAATYGAGALTVKAAQETVELAEQAFSTCQ